jgi:hypothetical protein
LQNTQPAHIHSATGGSGLEVAITLALALWCSTVPVARRSSARCCCSAGVVHGGFDVPSTARPCCRAILANANALILAHNHPSGNVEPSNADKQVTALLVNAGNILDVKILDHVIIGSKGGYYSFRDHSLI